MEKPGYKGDLEIRRKAITKAKQDFLDAEDESDLVYGNQVTQKKLRKDKNFLSRIFKKKKTTSDGGAKTDATGPTTTKSTTTGSTTTNDRGDKTPGTSSAPKYNKKDTQRESYRGRYFFGGRVGFKDGGLASIL